MKTFSITLPLMIINEILIVDIRFPKIYKVQYI